MGIPLQTEVQIKRSVFDLNHQTPIITIGSCFSDHIGELLLKYKFQVLKNPFGVLYNPFSIIQALKLVLQQKKIKPEELIYRNGLWHSFFFHSSFSGTNKKKVIENINSTIASTYAFLKQACYLIVTFGTAWAYRHNQSQTIVSNCHKIPSTEFTRFRLTINDIVEGWKQLINLLNNFNPGLNIIFTVSPIRHLKDGAHENQLSKSVLLLAIDNLLSVHPECDYFPSYEIVHDELRDYRFYADDMVHISDKAVCYVFEKFKMAYFSEQTNECIQQIIPVIQAANHRIITNNVKETKKFADVMLKKINLLENIYPFINFLLEKEHFRNL